MGDNTHEPARKPWIGLIATSVAMAVIGMPASAAEEEAEDESESSWRKSSSRPPTATRT